MAFFNLLVSFILFPIINRWRGGGSGFLNNLPGRPIYWATILTFPTFLVVSGNIFFAGCMALTYFIWAVYGWGLWFDLNRLPVNDTESRNKRWLEKTLTRISGGNDYIAFTLRHIIFVSPGIAFTTIFFGLTYWLIPFGTLFFSLLVTSAYYLGWKYIPNYPTVAGEYITGFMIALCGNILWLAIRSGML